MDTKNSAELSSQLVSFSLCVISFPLLSQWTNCIRLGSSSSLLIKECPCRKSSAVKYEAEDLALFIELYSIAGGKKSQLLSHMLSLCLSSKGIVWQLQVNLSVAYTNGILLHYAGSL